MALATEVVAGLVLRLNLAAMAAPLVAVVAEVVMALLAAIMAAQAPEAKYESGQF
jgi:hypothetical protein